jgi:hypothetical protein
MSILSSRSRVWIATAKAPFYDALAAHPFPQSFALKLNLFHFPSCCLAPHLALRVFRANDTFLGFNLREALTISNVF